MFNKKRYILILLIASIFMISAVSAADNATDAMATDDANADEISISTADDLEKTDEQVDDDVKLASSQEDSQLSLDESSEPLSYVSGDSYKVDLRDEYEISANEEGRIPYYREPCTNSSADAYHYYICVFDNKLNINYKSKDLTSTNRNNGNFTHKIPKNSLAPGTYVIKVINYDDGKIMDSAVLRVKGEAKFTASDYNAVYKSDSKMTITLRDKTSGKLITTSKVQVVFTQGKTTITKYYKTNTKGQISFVPPLSKGAWSVKITPTESHITGSITKLAVIKKASVDVKAEKVSEYKGYKIKLKATVKTKNGKKVNEGKIQFKINGKTYNAAVKNGVATYFVYMKKVYEYRYSARYLGTGNLYDSGKSMSKATLKQSFATKIYPGAYKIKATKFLRFTVKSVYGKKIKDGQLKVKMKKAFWIKVYNGKATFKLKKYMKNAYYKKQGKISVKYIPTTHKYHSTYKKYKLRR